MNKQLFVTAVVLMLSILLFEFSNIDIWIQDHLYSIELHSWLLDRTNLMAKLFFYDGIKIVLVSSTIIAVVSAVVFRKSYFVQNNKQGIVIVLVSAILIPLTVGALKATTNMPCPRDITHYGGNYPHITLLTSYPGTFYQAEKIKCYPAGHASGGFALLSLLFLFRTRRHKIQAVLAVQGIGWSMGIYKMLIGDHFFSHTLITMILAWFIILLIAKSVYLFTSNYNSRLFQHNVSAKNDFQALNSTIHLKVQ